MSLGIWFIIFLFASGFVLYHRASLLVWTITTATVLLLSTFLSTAGVGALTFSWLIFAAVTTPFLVPDLRRKLFSRKVFVLMRRVLPSMSDTERAALEAGTVSWEGRLFTGMPNWQELENMKTPKLTEEEQAFYDGPVNELCRMVNDWEITNKNFDLPQEIWQFLKTNGFFGLIIPKKYGGKEFSAFAHSEILIKVYSASITCATTIAVPNSIGPAELLWHYGTQQQKDYYLPRLAKGDEIPCFALTAPEAGSDAGSLTDKGVICKGKFKGEETIGIKLTWNKRYITLAPVATVLGLAFKLYDPDHLIGEKEDYGITVALVPTDLPGISIGRRHRTLQTPFQNGPTQGDNVFIPLDYIIGGAEQAGQGWRMLMECLSVGRAISLPASSMGGIKVGCFATGAYARIRKQFNVPISQFEGIQEGLTRIAGFTYITDATRLLTIAAIDAGEKPAILSAITKYHVTELGRKAALDMMDIHGGKAICLGPNNYLATHYLNAPIAITVEGANILTRSLIIFGQGAIRCHPHVYNEMQALTHSDQEQGLIAFDKAFFGHIGYLLSNIFRSFFLGLTKACFVRAPKGEMRRYYQGITQISAAFALVADFAMITLGGSLKRRERLSARLGDVLSMLYICSAVLKKHKDNNNPVEDNYLVHWCCKYALYEAQQALLGVLKNFPNRMVAWCVKWWIFPLGRRYFRASDKLSGRVAKIISEATDTRERLAEGMYFEAEQNNPISILNRAFHKVIAAEPIEKKIHQAVRDNIITGQAFPEMVESACIAGVINESEKAQLLEMHALRLQVINVDDFDPSEFGIGASRQESSSNRVEH